jgi:hypothetical protein
MKHIISLLAILIIAAGCGQEWKTISLLEGKNNPSPIPSPDPTKLPYPKHKADECPVELVGQYKHSTEDLIVKIYFNGDGVLVGIPIYEGKTMADRSMIADGFEHEIDDGDMKGQRLSYCEDHKIFTFGEVSGHKFDLMLVKTKEGIDVHDGTTVYSFKKVKKVL